MHLSGGINVQLSLLRFKDWLFNTFVSKRVEFNNQSELMERLSHELRTSLTGIVGYSEFVESSSTEPMVSFTAKIIRESSQDLARASISFFDLHRLGLGQIKVNCYKFSISELVGSVVKTHQKQAIEREATLVYTHAAEVLFLDVFTDAQRVRQIVDALVFAAVNSASKGKIVHLDLSLDGEDDSIKLVINYLDSMNDEVQVKLLNEFWCSKRYKFRLQEGPGVELALAKSLIYFLQGSAEFCCESNELSLLIVKLPMRYKQSKVAK